MFKRIRVQDYQSIKEADIALSPFTVIVGKSRSGKSAFLRALRGAIFNETGDDLIRWGQKEAIVEIETQEGDVITWTKTRTSAEYDLNGNRYTKLAGGVPDDIASAIGVRSVVVDATLTLTPQLHEQGQYAFLIDRSQGQAAKALAKMTRLDVVVKAQQHCKSAVREVRDNLKAVKKNIERLEPELDGWDEAANAQALDWNANAQARAVSMHDALFQHDRGDRARHVLMELDTLCQREITVDADGLITKVERIGAIGKAVDKLMQTIPQRVNVAAAETRMEQLEQGFDAMFDYDGTAYDLAEADGGLADREHYLQEAEVELAAVKVCPLCGGAM